MNLPTHILQKTTELKQQRMYEISDNTSKNIVHYTFCH